MTLTMKDFKDTNGIYKPKELEERKGGFSRPSGTPFVGTVHLGYVPSVTDYMPVHLVRPLD